MNQKAAKNERRQIRRVIGDDAASLMSTAHAVLARHENAIAENRRAWEIERDNRQRHDAEMRQRIEVLEKLPATFYGRLRLLFTGKREAVNAETPR